MTTDGVVSAGFPETQRPWQPGGSGGCWKLEWGEQEALPGRCELGSSGRSPIGPRQSVEVHAGSRARAGAGPVLAGWWEHSGGPHQKAARPHSGCLPGHTRPLAQHDGAGRLFQPCGLSLCSGNLSDHYPWWGSAATTGKPPFSVKFQGQNLGAPSGSDNTFCPLRHSDSSCVRGV